MSDARGGPLNGVRVLDFTTDVAGPYATKLLADYGASVLKVEPIEGDPSRRAGPFLHNQPHPETSARFLHLNTNKRGITLNLETVEARHIVSRLIADVDVVIEDFAPGYLASIGFGYQELKAQRPDLLLASLTPWGQSGPYVGMRQSDLVVQAMGGPMIWTGSAEREPLRLGGAGALAHSHAGAMAAVAILVASYRREFTGEGEHIDVSIYEVQAASRDRSAPYLTNHIYNGMEPKRRAAGTTVANGVRPVLDGYVNISATGARRLPAFLKMIGVGHLIEDPRLNLRSGGPLDPGLADEIETAYMDWLMQRGKQQAVSEAQEQALSLGGAINTPGDLLADPHYRERDVWEVIDHPHTGPLEYPGRPFIMSDSPRPPATRAPLLSEHTDEVLRSIGYESHEIAQMRSLRVI